jgi:hypothetical protein
MLFRKDNCNIKIPKNEKEHVVGILVHREHADPVMPVQGTDPTPPTRMTFPTLVIEESSS